MQDTCYLIFNRSRILRSNVQRAPALGPGEFAVKVKLVVPPVYFDHAIPQVTLTVTQDSVMKGIDLETEPAPTEPVP